MCIEIRSLNEIEKYILTSIAKSQSAYSKACFKGFQSLFKGMQKDLLNIFTVNTSQKALDKDKQKEIRNSEERRVRI